jgi:hypothetical protein
MSDEPLTNAAVEIVRRNVDAMNLLEDSSGFAPAFADGFVYDDRRRVVSFGVLDADGYTRALRLNWDVDSERPQIQLRDVIATRGSRLALLQMCIARSGGFYTTDFIMVFLVDATLSLPQRVVDFDIEERDAAMAELDRLHAEIDD